jgi:helicase
MMRAQFIGIDRHQDICVPDLTGAVRDATALWALFTDTITEIDSELITDEKATVARIRESLDKALKGASEDDVVLIFFAGHGTRDHRFVTHDTNLESLEASTISMSELANRFKESTANIVICILDCCFSGGAPARVLEGTPASREAPFEMAVLGKGRVMITASGFDEPAFEHPVRRHGLLTAALIDILTEGTGPISLATALDNAQQRVRAAAASIRRIQNPVIFNFIEGGLTLPILRPGERFRKYFPELGHIKVDRKLENLSSFGLPPVSVQAWAERFPDGLHDLQLEAINDYRVLDGESLLVVAPTSSGKTFIGEIAAIKAITEGRKVVFLLPYRALVNEKYEDFSALYGDKLGLRVIRCSGDYLDQTTAFMNGKFEIGILTYEMFLALALGNPAVLNRLGLVVLDEAQFISDPNRGIIVELILAFLRSVRLQGIEPQTIMLSATIGDLNGFNEWFGLRALLSNKRPVPLEIGVMDRNGTFEYLDAEGKSKVKQLLSPGSIAQRKSQPSSQDIIVPLVRNLVKDEQKREKIIIFRSTRGATEGCANYLSQELGLPAADKIIRALPSRDLSSTSESLRRALSGGTAFHNTNLSRDERIMVEQSFRDASGPVRVLAATTTVAAGVNTPASTVIIAENTFPPDDQPFTVAEMINMAGRAGRLGYRETGRAIILAPNEFDRHRLFIHYVMGKPEPVTSSFRGEHIGTWLLRLLAQVAPLNSKNKGLYSGIAKEELPGLIVSTFGGYLQSRNNPEWPQMTVRQVQEFIPRLQGDGLLEDEKGHIYLTPLGKTVAQSALPLESALRFIENLNRLGPGSLTPEQLMVLVQAIPEMDNHYTPLFKRGQREAQWPGEMARRYGNSITRILSQRTGDAWVYYARAKRACILDDWIAGRPIQEIENRYTINPIQGALARGDIQSISDTTRFYLRSAYNIATLVRPAETPDPDSMEKLLTRLEYGLPSEMMPLLQLPILFSRGEYLALKTAGIKAVDDFWKADEQKLAQLISPLQLSSIKRFRPATER